MRVSNAYIYHFETLQIGTLLAAVVTCGSHLTRWDYKTSCWTSWLKRQRWWCPWVSWGTSLDSRAAKEKTTHHKSRYHTFRSRYLMISMFFLGFLYMFPDFEASKTLQCLGPLVQIHPLPGTSQIWQRKRPDWSKVPQDVGSQVMEASPTSSSPWKTALLLNHFDSLWRENVLMTFRFSVPYPSKLLTFKSPKS